MTVQQSCCDVGRRNCCETNGNALISVILPVALGEYVDSNDGIFYLLFNVYLQAARTQTGRE